ncbi:MAG: tRNA preQ1(34) S-adenosylmethionine ribosyltransferase-isomerase QueA [Candidatus Shapirobacteria bacterium]
MIIANSPASPRDSCKLLKIDRESGKTSHHRFYDLPSLLTPNDILVFNDTRVFPARLFGQKPTGGKIEVLLLEQLKGSNWQAISSPLPKLGQILKFDNLLATVIKVDPSFGKIEIKFNLVGNDFFDVINKIGHTPLPPYINSSQAESTLRRQYQTVYAQKIGSAAAPTAGLHFTNRLLNKLEDIGIHRQYITLHVGLGTFQSLRPENLKTGKLHTEHYYINSSTAKCLNDLKNRGFHLIAVGTTTVRCLESAVSNGQIRAGEGSTDIFIRPGYKFKFIDGLITNFHLPDSSLLMLVSAFVSSPSFITKAYQEAVKNNYRFYSFGDACLIL